MTSSCGMGLKTVAFNIGSWSSSHCAPKRLGAGDGAYAFLLLGREIQAMFTLYRIDLIFVPTQKAIRYSMNDTVQDWNKSFTHNGYHTRAVGRKGLVH